MDIKGKFEIWNAICVDNAVYLERNHPCEFPAIIVLRLRKRKLKDGEKKELEYESIVGDLTAFFASTQATIIERKLSA